MSKTDRNQRLVPGEYQWPHDHAAARSRFFAAIQRDAPEVLTSLYDDVLPQVQGTTQERGILPPGDPALMAPVWLWADRHHLLGHDRVDASDQESALPPAYHGIARLMHAADVSPPDAFFFQWVLFAAWGTLKAWAEAAERPAELRFTLPCRDCGLLEMSHDLPDLLDVAHSVFFPADATPGIYRFRSPSWVPTVETRAQCVERILADVRRQLDEVLDSDEQQLTEIGFEKTPGAFTPEHFTWLVRFQLQGWNHSRIRQAAHPKRSTQTIRDGIQSAAQLVIGRGWEQWLRCGQPGRPRKTS